MLKMAGANRNKKYNMVLVAWAINNLRPCLSLPTPRVGAFLLEWQRHGRRSQGSKNIRLLF